MQRRHPLLWIGGVLTLGLLAFSAGLAVVTAAPATATSTSTSTSNSAAATSATSAATPAAAQGYWLVAADGGVFTFGDAAYYGSTGAIRLNQPIVGMAATPDGKGYWLVAADGGVFTFGDAAYYGSTGAIRLNQPIVGMAATPDGKGYWLVASDGGIFAFADAGFYGSTGAIRLNQPIVGMAATPDGQGYWLVAADGGVFTFGDAGFYGSTGAIRLNKPIVGTAATPDGKGYWLVAADGGVFAFGDAGYFGSAAGINSQVEDIVGASPTSNGQGYWIAGSDGAVHAFGTAAAEGPPVALPLNRPIVGTAAVPSVGSGQGSPAPLSVSRTSLAVAAKGAPYAASLAATGGAPPYSWISLGALPAGLSLSPSGDITGTPTAPGRFTFTVQVTDSTAPTPLTATATMSISVVSPPPSITTTTLPAAVAGTAYSAVLSATGATAPYTWAVIGGTLPTGLTLSPGGTITGTPSGQGSASFTVRVTDASPTPLVASGALSIAVFPATSSVSLVASGNWSGYVELNGPFTSVTGTFSVPSLLADTPAGDLMAEWVGIDGGNPGNAALIQAGFNETPDPGDPANPKGFYIQPWWEILPAAETYITTVSIQPGDRVTVTIAQISGTDWRITLTDDTNGGTFTTDQAYSGPASTAEWILEALTVDNTVAPLAPFSPVVTFGNLGFTGPSADLQRVVMLQSSNQVATPSTLTPDGFNVAYGSTAPPPP